MRIEIQQLGPLFVRNRYLNRERGAFARTALDFNLAAEQFRQLLYDIKT